MALCIHCTVNGADDRVVHSYGRLIPHEFPITDLQQISGLDGIGRITCTDSSGTAGFFRSAEQPETDGVSQTGNTATLIVNQSSSFENRDLYCNDLSTYFYLFISGNSEFTIVTRAYIKMQIASLRSLDRPECKCRKCSPEERAELIIIPYHAAILS